MWDKWRYWHELNIYLFSPFFAVILELLFHFFCKVIGQSKSLWNSQNPFQTFGEYLGFFIRCAWKWTSRRPLVKFCRLALWKSFPVANLFLRLQCTAVLVDCWITFEGFILIIQKIRKFENFVPAAAFLEQQCVKSRLKGQSLKISMIYFSATLRAISMETKHWRLDMSTLDVCSIRIRNFVLGFDESSMTLRLTPRSSFSDEMRFGAFARLLSLYLMTLSLRALTDWYFFSRSHYTNQWLKIHGINKICSWDQFDIGLCHNGSLVVLTICNEVDDVISRNARVLQSWNQPEEIDGMLVGQLLALVRKWLVEFKMLCKISKERV